MSNEMEFAVEIGAATAEIKQAAGVITGMKTQVDGLNTRFQALEEKTAAAEKDQLKMCDAIDDLEKLMRTGMKTTRGHSFSGEGFKAFAGYVAKGEGMTFPGMKGISEQTDMDGRAALPLEISNFVQDQLLEINPMRRLANVVSVDSPNFRHLVNVKGVTSRWGKEIDTRDQTETPQIEKIEPLMLEHYAYAEITQWAARDLFNGRAETWLRENIIEEFARSEAEKFITGTGNDEPHGLLNTGFSYDTDAERAFGTWGAVKSGDAAAVTPDALITTVFNLGASYRCNASWLMNSATAGTIRKLKDADGRYLWTDSLIQGKPPSLLGHPVEIAEEMPDISAGETPVAFGDFKRGYVIADLNTYYVLRDEVTKPGWIKLYVFRRLGSHVADTKAVRLMEVAT